MKFLSILTLLAFCLFSATTAVAQFSLPYRVDASKAAGVNVRSGPGSRYATIGVVNVGETVMILETDAGEHWGRITWNGAPAWVYIRLMEPAIPGAPASTPSQTPAETQNTTPPVPVEPPKEEEVAPVEGLTAAQAASQAAADLAAEATANAEAKVSGISCEGTAPSWSARITGNRDFVFLEEDGVAQHRIIENAGTSVNSPNVQMFAALDYTGVLRGGQCNNGLSGKNYSLVLDLIFNDGESAKMYSGCCSVSGN